MGHRCRYCKGSFRKSDHKDQHERAVHGEAMRRDEVARRDGRRREAAMRMVGEMGLPAEALALPAMIGRLLR